MRYTPERDEEGREILPAPFLPGDRVICILTEPERRRESHRPPLHRKGDILTIAGQDIDGDMFSVEPYAPEQREHMGPGAREDDKRGQLLFRDEWAHVDGRKFTNPRYGAYMRSRRGDEAARTLLLVTLVGVLAIASWIWSQLYG